MSDEAEKKAQVLLVEDNLTDATLIRTILEKGGDVRVTLAQDGIRGCQLVESHRWDLVVTDFNLPGRDGIEVILSCKASQPDTPIISTSGFPGQAHRDGAFRGGASEVLGKPIDPEDLWNTARGLLEIQMRESAKPKVVLAIGALPGDLEAGCGGTLIKHNVRGDKVHVLVLTVGAKGSEAEYQVTAARKAARVMGAEIHLPEVFSSQIPALDAALIQVQDTVYELEPDTVFAPSSNDVRESRQRANQAADLGTGKNTNLLCYQAASTTLEFRPTHFEDISDFLDDKMAALSHFQDQAEVRPHLHPGLSRAAARYWGRFLGYGEVEPFEVVRHNL